MDINSPGVMDEPPKFLPHAMGHTLMARGSCGAKAPPRAQNDLN